MNKKRLLLIIAIAIILTVIIIPAVLYACWWGSGLLHFGFYGNITIWVPEEGIWYCEELDMQLSFSSSDDSYIVIDGEKVICSVRNNRGSKTFSLLIQESGVPNYKLGDAVFRGEHVSLTEEAFTVKDRDSRKQYVFIRCD